MDLGANGCPTAITPPILRIRGNGLTLAEAEQAVHLAYTLSRKGLQLKMKELDLRNTE